MSPTYPQPVSWNDLPKFNPWPARLLGQAHFAEKQRTRDEVLREYHRDKWGGALEWLRSRDEVSLSDLLEMQGCPAEAIMPFARGDELFLAPARDIALAYLELLAATLQPYRSAVLVELGCGLGDKLLALAAPLSAEGIWGGEFTEAGIECSRRLAELRGLSAEFEHFDYTDPRTVGQVPKEALVFTSHSIEQIPVLPESFIEALIRRAPKMVVHFEPGYEAQDETTCLGLARRRYWEINDYNRNLLGLLRSFEARRKIRIVDYQPNAFSGEPLNATSIIAWTPSAPSVD